VQGTWIELHSPTLGNFSRRCFDLHRASDALREHQRDVIDLGLLWGPHLVAPQLPAEDPDQPEPTGKAREQAINDEVPKTILTTLHFVLLVVWTDTKK
jgi:hypothetical protein